MTKEDLVSASHAHPVEYVQLTIGDNGAGIEATIVDRIFDPYFTTKETGKGTGMDMAIVHGIVTIYCGLIILCASYSNLISEDRVKGMGIKGFALKPLTKKNIATLICEVLDQQTVSDINLQGKRR